MDSNEKDPNEIEDEIEEGGDAGQDDDEGGDEAETGQESSDAEGEEGQVDERPSRATRAVLEAKKAVREANEARAALEKEIQQLRAERQQRETQPKQESAQDEQVRLQLMTAEERMEYKLDKATREHNFQLNVMRFQSADMADKASYTAKAESDPIRKKYAQEVEELLAQERRTGRDLPRDTIYYFIRGRNADKAGPARDRAKAAGAARIQSQQARADSGRSDRAPPRRNESGNSLRDLEKRLDGVNI